MNHRAWLVWLATFALSAPACTKPNPAFVTPGAGGIPGDGPPSELPASSPDTGVVEDSAVPHHDAGASDVVDVEAPVATDTQTPVPVDGAVEVAPPADAPSEPVAADSPIDGPADLAPDQAPDVGSVDSASGIDLRQGLVGYWPLDEGMGTATSDRGSFGNHGQLTGGATWAAGFPAQFANPASVSLDGVNDTVKVASVVGLPALGAPMTISLWTWFPDPLPNMVRDNLVAYTNFDAEQGIQFGFESGRAAVWLWGDNTSFVMSNVLTPRSWYHLAYVFDGNTHFLHVNGIQVGQSNRAKHVGRPAELHFGSYGANTQYFPGRIDDIRFYDRALVPAEIAALAEGR